MQEMFLGEYTHKKKLLKSVAYEQRKGDRGERKAIYAILS